MVALAFGFYALSLGQDSNWDLLNYHLYNPYAFLTGRIEIDLAPAGLQTYFNPLLDIGYFSVISYLGPRTVGFLLGFLQGLNFFLVYQIAKIVLGDRKPRELHALLLALAGVLSVSFLAEIGTTMHDNLVALFPLLSLWLVLSCVGSLGKGHQGRHLVLIVFAGLLAGIGIGLKLVLAIYAVPICLSFLVLPLPWLRRFKLSFLFGVSVLAGLFVTGSYWMFEMWRLFGNPLFPQFNNYFHGEMVGFEEIRDTRFLPDSLFDKIFYPFIFSLDSQRVAELKFQQISWPFAYIAMLGLLLGRVIQLFRNEAQQRNWRPEAGFLLAFLLISYFLWLSIFGIYRYLVVIELLIPLLLFVAITYFFRARNAAWAAIAFIAVITMVNVRGVPDWGHSEWADHVYSVEANELASTPEPAVVYLAGQPVAWIIPALNIQSPFIQLAPNMPVTEAYWQRARILTANRSGKSYLVYAEDFPDVQERARFGLQKLDLSLDDSDCGFIVAHIGTARFEYRYCEIGTMEPE